MDTQTRYEHIVLNEHGVPMIEGTTMKVVELILSQHAYGWSPEEIHFQYPTLSLGQIHSALAYYWDHKEALDRDLAEREEKVATLQAQTPRSPIQERLRRR